MASFSSAVPPTAVYFEKFVWMAAMAASLMCCGVEKWGSPAPKSTTSIPCWRSLSASATTAMVAEGSMRLMRSVRRTGWVTGVMTVLMLTVLKLSFPRLTFALGRRLARRRLAVLKFVSHIHFLTNLLRDEFRHQAIDGPAELRDFAYQTRTQVRIFFGGHHEHRFQTRLEFAVHQRHLEFVLIVAKGANAAQDDPRLDAQRVVHGETVKSVHRHVVKVRSHSLQHLATIGDAEQRVFLGIPKNGNHQLVENPAAALDQVQMAVGGRVERSGIGSFYALHRGPRLTTGSKQGGLYAWRSGNGNWGLFRGADGEPGVPARQMGAAPVSPHN